MPTRMPRGAPALLLVLSMVAAGCAGRRPPAPLEIDMPVTSGEVAAEPVAAPDAAAEEPAAVPTAGGEAPAPAGTASQEMAQGAAAPAAIESAPATQASAAGQETAGRPSLRDLCRQDPAEEAFVDATRRRLAETFCGANLWFDGLFGGHADVENARQISGRVELSGLYTEFDGFDPKGRLRLRYELPTLERRVNLFLGRDDEDEFIEDRREGFAVRSSVFGLETEEKWLAGLGYSPPGRWSKKLDFRLGGRVKSSPEVFIQTRYRRNIFVGEESVWRFRETIFWENRDGFGSTTSADYDRVLRPNLLFRSANVGTVSEATDGLAWRSAVLLYQNLRRSRAVAGELFWRGSTGAPVELREYGTRAVYRQPLGNPHLYGDFIVGYTWPRKEVDQRREGSTMIGFGIELLFGQEPL